MSKSGTATVKQGELSTVIEIIGDSSIKVSRGIFYLLLTNPQGASFPTGVTEIKTKRIIVDDD